MVVVPIGRKLVVSYLTSIVSNIVSFTIFLRKFCDLDLGNTVLTQTMQYTASGTM